MTADPGEVTDINRISRAMYEVSVRMTRKYGVSVEMSYRRSWMRVTLGFAVPDLGVFQDVPWRRWGSQEWREVRPVTKAANAVGAAIRAHSS